MQELGRNDGSDRNKQLDTEPKKRYLFPNLGLELPGGVVASDPSRTVLDFALHDLFHRRLSPSAGCVALPRTHARVSGDGAALSAHQPQPTGSGVVPWSAWLICLSAASAVSATAAAIGNAGRAALMERSPAGVSSPLRFSSMTPSTRPSAVSGTTTTMRRCGMRLALVAGCATSSDIIFRSRARDVWPVTSRNLGTRENTSKGNTQCLFPWERAL